MASARPDFIGSSGRVLVTGATGSVGRRLVPRLLEAEVGRIVYLGGLGDPESALSVHLRSRQETGAVLRESGVPVTEFGAEPIDTGTSRLVQTAYFAPRGLSGLLYWYLLYPIHAVIFSGLVKRLGDLAESIGRAPAGRRRNPEVPG